jgi:acyl carrier protein
VLQAKERQRRETGVSIVKDESSLEDSILSQVVRELGDEGLSRGLGSDSALMSSGLLDSITTLRLVMSLEKTFSISSEGADLTVENFDTVGQIAEFIRLRLPA